MSVYFCPLPTEIEQRFVLDTYREIAQSFDNTRAYLWECVKMAIANLTPNSVVLEVGCGNGKNLKAIDRPDIIKIGCDVTDYFVQVSQGPNIDTFVATNLALPFRSVSVDLVMSVAVLHHFETDVRRLQALEELLRLVRPGGRLLLQVWAKEQPLKSRRQFTISDNLVGWHTPDKSLYRERFYHVFQEGELEDLLFQSSLFRDTFRVLRSWYEVGNWVTYLERTIPNPSSKELS